MATIDRELELERVIFFSDAVFAIAVTLLALSLPVPVLVRAAGNQSFFSALQSHGSDVLAFLISFAVISQFWLGHHRIFALIVRWNRGLLVLNLLFLGFVVVQPWATRLLASYGDLSGPTILYALLVTACSVSLYAVWAYAQACELTIITLSRRGWVLGSLRALASAMVFLASVPIALANPTAAKYFWVMLVPAEYALERWARRAGAVRPTSSAELEALSHDTGRPSDSP